MNIRNISFIKCILLSSSAFMVLCFCSFLFERIFTIACLVIAYGGEVGVCAIVIALGGACATYAFSHWG
jgi:hypothetical protein